MTIVKNLFNKKIKDLNKYELNEYMRNLPSRLKRIVRLTPYNYTQSFCYNYFNKRYKELNSSEKREFNRIMKAREREKLKEGNNEII